MSCVLWQEVAVISMNFEVRENELLELEEKLKAREQVSPLNIITGKSSA